MLNIYSYLAKVGLPNTENLKERKKAALINKFCIFWYHTSIVFIVTDYFFVEDPLNQILGNSAAFLGLVFVQYLQYKSHYKWAIHWFIVMCFLDFYFFANVLAPSSLVEFYFLAIPGIGLIFYDNKKVNVALLILSIFKIIQS